MPPVRIHIIHGNTRMCYGAHTKQVSSKHGRDIMMTNVYQINLLHRRYYNLEQGSPNVACYKTESGLQQLSVKIHQWSVYQNIVTGASTASHDPPPVPMMGTLGCKGGCIL